MGVKQLQIFKDKALTNNQQVTIRSLMGNFAHPNAGVMRVRLLVPADTTIYISTREGVRDDVEYITFTTPAGVATQIFDQPTDQLTEVCVGGEDDQTLSFIVEFGIETLVG